MCVCVYAINSIEPFRSLQQQQQKTIIYRLQRDTSFVVVVISEISDTRAGLLAMTVINRHRTLTKCKLPILLLLLATSLLFSHS